MASSLGGPQGQEEMAKFSAKLKGGTLPGERDEGEGYKEAGRHSERKCGEREMADQELRRVQLAHEGMRLLLCSQVKQADELFRKSR